MAQGSAVAVGGVDGGEGRLGYVLRGAAGGDGSGGGDNGGGESDGLDSGGSSQGGGSIGSRASSSGGGLSIDGAVNLEGVGELEDGGVALEADDEAVDGVLAKGGIDSPVVGEGGVRDAGCDMLETIESVAFILVVLTGNVEERDLSVLSSTSDQVERDGLASVLVNGAPGDLEGGASGNDLSALGSEDGVEVGSGILSQRRGGKAQEGSGSSEELHCELGCCFEVKRESERLKLLMLR